MGWFSGYDDCGFSDLVGCYVKSVNVSEDEDQVDFTVLRADGDKVELAKYRMFHEQDCCESVYIADIDNDIQKLVGTFIVEAEESVSDDAPEDIAQQRSEMADWDCESETWTFYKLANNRGDRFTIRWYGGSNGYYSEEVTFCKMLDN